MQYRPRQKWHADLMPSQLVHSGVNCPLPQHWSGMRSSALQKSHKFPVLVPQSTHGRQKSAGLLATDSTSILAAEVPAMGPAGPLCPSWSDGAAVMRFASIVS